MAALTNAELLARIAELESAKADADRLTFKVSDKQAVSVYGLQQFPVTLYLDQWERLLGQADAIRSFIQANRMRLVTKKESILAKNNR